MKRPEKKFENPLQEYWKILNKRRLWVILPLFVILLITMLYSMSITVFYRSSTKILIETDPPKLLQDQVAIFNYNKDYYQTQFEILKSRPIIYEVVKALPLDREYPPPESSFSTVMKKFHLPPPSNGRKQLTPESLVPIIQRSISISPLTKTGLVNISVSAPKPLLAKDIANTVIDIFVAENLKARNQAMFDASEYFANQLSKLNEKMQRADKILEGFEREEGLEGFKGWEKFDYNQFSEYVQKLATAKSERWEMEERIRTLRRLVSQQSFVDLSIPLLKSETLDQLSRELFNAEMKLTKLRQQDYKEEHPFIQKEEEQVNLVKKQLVNEAGKIINSLDMELAVLKNRESNLEGMIQSFQKVVADTDKKKAEHDYLRREKEIYQALYLNYDQQLKKLQLFENIQPSNIRVIEPALPGYAVRPNHKFHLLVGLLAGLTLGVSLAFFREYLDNTIKSAEDVQAYLNSPVVGTIPVIGGGKGGSVLLNPGSRSTSVTAEAYRSLRTNLQFFEANRPLKVILVTSSGPSEGKTTTVANLGITLAQMGKKVCVVDTDLRKPALHKIFKKSNRFGITSIFAGVVAKKDLLIQSGRPGLSLLFSGPPPPNPSEIVASEQMAQAINNLKSDFDYILLDSPPLLAVTDASLLSRLADGVLMIVLAGGTTISLCQSALSQLEKARSDMIGVVLNRMKAVDSGYYYYYYSKYYTSEDRGKKKKIAGPQRVFPRKTTHSAH